MVWVGMSLGASQTPAAFIKAPTGDAKTPASGSAAPALVCVNCVVGTLKCARARRLLGYMKQCYLKAKVPLNVNYTSIRKVTLNCC